MKITIDYLQKILNESKLCWWLDSGSLLGIIRDGHFLKNDKDIDLGIAFNGNYQHINDFLSLIESLGFRTVKFYINSNIYKCKCIPINPSVFNYILDIQIYYKVKDCYICPQMVFKSNLSLFNRIRQNIIRIKKGNRADYKGKSFPVMIRRAISRFICNNNLTIELKQKEKSLYDFYQWVIPENYLINQTEYHGYKVFADYKNYLSYRYGNWQIPVKNWVFTRDDKALYKSNYESICEQLNQ